MTEPKAIHIGECTILLWRLGHHLITEFADGLQVPAAPNYDEHSIKTAAELGYSDTWEMSMHHELCHTLIAEAQGYPYSRVLRGVAVRAAGGRKEDVISRADSDFEEGLVLDFQRWYMTGISTPRLEQSGLDLEAAAAQLREMTE